jgi:hypothetical protein
MTLVPIGLIIALIWAHGQLIELPADPRLRVVLLAGHVSIVALAAVGACHVAELLSSAR